MEDNADLMLTYKNGIGLFEGSWDLPRSYQDLEVFGLKGSVYMKNGSVEKQEGRNKTPVDITPLAPEVSISVGTPQALSLVSRRATLASFKTPAAEGGADVMLVRIRQTPFVSTLKLRLMTAWSASVCRAGCDTSMLEA